VVGSTKTITVADQLHLSRFAGDIGGHFAAAVVVVVAAALTIGQMAEFATT